MSIRYWFQKPTTDATKNVPMWEYSEKPVVPYTHQEKTTQELFDDLFVRLDRIEAILKNKYDD
jgi:hypothetical protein